MRTRILAFGVGCALTGCVQHPRPVPIQNDRSIVFPQFFEQDPVEVGAKADPYELEGVVLQAITIAANDFLPPSTKDRPCWDRPEAHRYRVIRQGPIIFVRIDEDAAFCGGGYVSLDSGAKYAISTDGRILRRVVDGEPEGPFEPQTPDAANPRTPGEMSGGSAGDAGPLPSSPDGGSPET
jgi:hypothetical protein